MTENEMQEQIKAYLKEKLTLTITEEGGIYGSPSYTKVAITLDGEEVTYDYINH